MHRVVYDSESGSTECPTCGKRLARCTCASAVPPAAGDGVVRVRRELRRGKPVSVITGLPLAAEELRRLAKALKIKCGCGGSCKDGAIEIQGDHREALTAELVARGYPVR